MEHVKDPVDAAEALAGEVLGPYGSRPARGEVDLLVAELIRRGEAFGDLVAAIPDGERCVRHQGGLAEWAYLVAHGPRDRGDHSAWNHARGLARVLRNLTRAVRAHRAEGLWCGTRICCVCDRTISGEARELPRESMSGARPSDWAHEPGDEECRPVTGLDPR